VLPQPPPPVSLLIGMANNTLSCNPEDSWNVKIQARLNKTSSEEETRSLYVLLYILSQRSVYNRTKNHINGNRRHKYWDLISKRAKVRRRAPLAPTANLNHCQSAQHRALNHSKCSARFSFTCIRTRSCLLPLLSKKQIFFIMYRLSMQKKLVELEIS
jgi:hypothetical protein